MRVKSYLLNIILVLVLLSSVSARRKKNCTQKDLKGTNKKRFKSRLQSCIEIGFKTKKCRRIQRKEHCRIIEDEWLMNKDCLSPGYIVHGMIEGQSFKQGGKMKYSCIKGYKLNGENGATCMKYGKWSNPTPTCEEIKCKSMPNVPEYASVSLRNLLGSKIGSIATYSCHTGYEIKDEANTVVCGESGQWSGKIPECKPIRCSSEPSDIKNLGFITLETPYKPIIHGEIPFRYKDKLNLYCEKGFERIGPQEIKCQSDGKWSALPKCVPDSV